MKLTIAGLPGSGKSTVSELLKERLGKNYSVLDIGGLRRKFAKDSHMTLDQFNEWSLNNPEKGDKFFDDQMKKFGTENSDFIVVARLGFYFIPDSIKIFLYSDKKVSAKRIFNQKSKENKRNELNTSTIEEQIIKNEERVQNDIKRYKELYNINPYEEKNFDILIDTTNLSPSEIVEKILEKIKN